MRAIHVDKDASVRCLRISRFDPREGDIQIARVKSTGSSKLPDHRNRSKVILPSGTFSPPLWSNY
jgi:hypothetical protein